MTDASHAPGSCIDLKVVHPPQRAVIGPVLYVDVQHSANAGGSMRLARLRQFGHPRHLLSCGYSPRRSRWGWVASVRGYGRGATRRHQPSGQQDAAVPDVFLWRHGRALDVGTRPETSRTPLAVTRRFDLTDVQWAVLEPLLPAPKRPGRPS